MTWLFKGLGKRALEFPGKSTTAGVSPLGRARIRYNDVLNRLEQSLSGAAYVPIGGGSGTPGGADTNVQFNDAGAFGGDANFTYDGSDVGIGVGDIIFGNTVGHNVTVAQSAVDTVGRDLTVEGGDGGDYSASAPGVGGSLTLLGGGGGATAEEDSGGAGGTAFLSGGQGGSAPIGVGGEGGSVFIDGGNYGSGTGINDFGSIFIGENYANDIQIGTVRGSMTGQIVNNLVTNAASRFVVRDPTSAVIYLSVDTTTGSERIQMGSLGGGVGTIDIGGGLSAIDIGGAGGSIGFLGAAAVTRPNVTGSRGGNAALASALTALASLGLITNSSTP